MRLPPRPREAKLNEPLKGEEGSRLVKASAWAGIIDSSSHLCLKNDKGMPVRAGNFEILEKVSVFYNCDVEEGSKEDNFVMLKEEVGKPFFVLQASGVTTPRQPTSELFTRAELNIHSR